MSFIPKHTFCTDQQKNQSKATTVQFPNYKVHIYISQVLPTPDTCIQSFKINKLCVNFKTYT